MPSTPQDRGAFPEQRMFERTRSWLVLAGLRLPALTPARALAALAGAVALQALPELPMPALMPIVLAGSCMAVAFARGDRVPVWFVIGFAWSVIRAD
jgi:hypothetical protein